MSKRKFKKDGENRLKFEQDELKVLSLRFFKDNQELPKKNILLSNMSSLHLKEHFDQKNIAFYRNGIKYKMFAFTPASAESAD